MQAEQRERRRELRSKLLKEARGLSIVDYASKHIEWSKQKTRRDRGDYWACCPIHGEKTPSFHVTASVNGRGKFKCFGCGASGDIVDLCMAIESVRLDDALLRLTGQKLEPTAQRFIDREQNAETDADKRRAALAIWDAGRPFAGSLAETYLRQARGVGGDLSAAELRFHAAAPIWGYSPEQSKRCPAMLAAIRKPCGEFLGVHVTYLKADGSGKADLDPARKVYGAKAGGFIRLGELSDRMVVGEGIESALAAADVCGRGAISAVTSENLAKLPVIDGVRDWLVAYDVDARQQGYKAGKAFAARVYAAGFTVRRFPPPNGCKDWNDAAQRRMA